MSVTSLKERNEGRSTSSKRCRSGIHLPGTGVVIVTIPMGDAIKLVGKGLNSGKVYEPILPASKIEELEVSPSEEPFDGDPQRFRLAIEAMRLALAFEYDPYFSLSIARVDPLPHQLEAVYQYFLALPRIRFLLADDPGAGKTIMAGLLLKELKIRGLVSRTLIITPANLSFQWQREMKDKFREQFDIIRSDVACELRLESLAGQEPSHPSVVGFAYRRREGKPARSHWDLIIVDEAHKMKRGQSRQENARLPTRRGPSQMTDHYLLMTATPHKAIPDNFCLFLELLDRDVYGDVKSLEEAMRKQEAPFHLRRVKEASSPFPIRDRHGEGPVYEAPCAHDRVSNQFRRVDFYDALTRFVEDQSIKAPRRLCPWPSSPSRWRCCNAALRRAFTRCAGVFSG